MTSKTLAAGLITCWLSIMLFGASQASAKPATPLTTDGTNPELRMYV